MAILYRNWDPVGKVINDALAAARIPITGHKNIPFGDKQDTVKLLGLFSVPRLQGYSGNLS